VRLHCVARVTGPNVVITGKTVEAHSKLPGTIHSVAEEVVAAGGQALALQLDVRDEQAITMRLSRLPHISEGLMCW